MTFQISFPRSPEEDDDKKNETGGDGFPGFGSSFERLRQAREQQSASSSGLYRRPSALTRTVLGSTSQLARDMTGVVDIGEQRRQELEGQRVAAPSQAPTGLAKWGQWWDEGQQLVGAGMGVLLTQLGKAGVPMPRTADELRAAWEDPELRQAMHETSRDRLIEYGNQLRRVSMENFETLAETPTDGKVEWVMREIVRMTPAMMATMVSAGGTAAPAAASALTAIAGAFQGAFGTSYLIEKGALQTELEKDLTPEQADTWATYGAVPIAALESVWEAYAAAKLARAALTKTIDPTVKRSIYSRIAQVAKEVILGMGAEGSTESAQEAVGIGIEYAATGEPPSPDEIGLRLATSFFAGAAGGGFYGGVFSVGGQGLEVFRESRADAIRAEAEARAAGWDPNSAPRGTTIAGKTRDVNDKGELVWKQGEEETTPPTAEEYRKETVAGARDAEVRERVEITTSELAPQDVPVRQAVEAVSGFHPTGVEPAVTELNVRHLASSGSFRKVGRQALNLTEQERNNRKAALELLALDPDSDTPYAVRVTALAQKRAIEYAERQRTSRVVEQLDVSAGARKWAQLDQDTFNSLAAQLIANGTEAERRQIYEAQRFRDAGEQLVAPVSKEVNERLGSYEQLRSRGVAVDTKVVTPEGLPATVKNVRPSGFLDVVTDEGEAAVVSPADVTLVPSVGRMVELSGGQLGTVTALQGGNATVVMMDGSKNVVPISSIENLEPAPEVVTQQEARVAQQRDPQTFVPRPIEVVDKRTGQPATLISFGSEVATLSNGDVISLDDVAFPSEPTEGAPHLVSEIAKTGVIPTFAPGTTPSAEGRHINFLQIPANWVTAFEQHLKTPELDPSVIQGYLQGGQARAAGATLTLLPQPIDTEKVTYAIELPADARSLTDAGKKILGALAGKSVKIHPQTRKAKVTLTRTLANDEWGVMKVPNTLLVGVDERNQDSEYLRRLTNLSFEISPAVAEAVTKAKTLSQQASTARITGNVAQAERLETEVAIAKAEIGEAAIDEEVKALDDLWSEFRNILYDGMSPQARTKVDVLNESTRDALLEIPGVGDNLADAILEQKAREKGGAFATFADVRKTQGVGPKVMEAISAAMQAGERPPGWRIGARREEQMKDILRDMPGRLPGEVGQPLAFRHPDNPSFILIVDKEIIPTTNDRVLAEMMEAAGRDISDLSAEEYSELASRAVYHMRYVTPEGVEILARTLGTEQTTVEIPLHLAVRSGGIGTPPATALINQGIAEGKTLDQIVEEMRADRREVQRVRLGGFNERMAALPGQPKLVPVSALTEEQIAGAQAIVEPGEVFEVLSYSRDGSTVTVQPVASREGESVQPFEISAGEISQQVGTVKEGDWKYTFPRRLTPEETLDQVMSHIRRFDRRAYQISTGEWRSHVPGVYGTIRRMAAGSWEVAITSPLTRDGAVHQLSTFDVIEYFPTKESAQEYLKAMDFVYASPRYNYQRNFEELPAVESMTVEEMYKAEPVLEKIINAYRTRGFMPQAVRDYSVSFASRWFQERLIPGYGGLFGSNIIRRAVGVETVHGAYLAAVRGAQHAMVLSPRPEVSIEGGTITIEEHSPAELENDVRVWDGVISEPSAPIDRAARAQAKALFRQQQARARFYDQVAEDGKPINSSSWRRLVTTTDGRTGILVDSKPGTNEVVVQLNIGGNPELVTLSKTDVDPIRHPDQALDYLRSVREADGEMTNYPITPEMGAHPYDVELGVNGLVDRDAYVKKLTQRVKAMVSRIAIDSSGNITGNPVKSIKGLAKAWVRIKEVGFTRAEIEAMGIPAPLISTKAALGQPSGEAGLIPKLAFDLIRDQYGPTSAYGDLLAKVKLGWTSTRIKNQIDEQAKLAGIDPDLPRYRKTEELMQNVWDPDLANQIYRIRNDVGALMFIGDGGVPEQGLELRTIAPVGTIRMNHLTKHTMLTKTAATKSPTLKILHHLLERARTDLGNEIRRDMDVIKGLMSVKGLNLEKRQQIWSLLENEKLAAIMDTPADILSEDVIVETLGASAVPQDFDWYYQYRAMRSLLVAARRSHIWDNLVRGFHPVEVTFKDNGNIQEAAEREMIDLRTLTWAERQAMEAQIEAGLPFYDLKRQPNPAYAYNETEANLFVDLLDTYNSYSDIPADIRSKLPPRMKDEFDFWARYGIKNYAPSIHRGRHKIYLKSTDGSPDKMIGTAPDVEVFERFVFLASRGRVEGIPANGQFYLVAGMARADELDIEHLGPARFKKVYAHLAKTYSGKDGKAAKDVSKIISLLGIGSDPSIPKNIHTQRRTDEPLAEVIEDPYERMLIYLSRTARAKYLLRVSHAYDTAREMDPYVSRAEGLEAVFKNDDHRTRGNPAAEWFARNMRDSYMGEQSESERRANVLMAIPIAFAKVISNPKRLAELRKRMDADPEHSIFYDPLFLEAVHNADYASKAAAHNLTALQSVLRLGLNITGAAINSMQHILHTPAYLILRGASPEEAYGWSIAAYKDAINYWRHVTPNLGPEKFGIPNPFSTADNPAYEELIKFAEDVGIGVVPGRAAAGPGMGIVGEAAPIFFADDPLFTKMNKTLEYAAMLPFSKAEGSVRLAAAFASKKMAMKLGMDYNEQVAFARDVIDNTQFQYYDQALPPAMRGSVQRILFQFQPFVVNALAYEKNLMLAVVGRGGALTGVHGNAKGKTITTTRGKQTLITTQAKRAAAAYWGTQLAFGGVARFAASPWLAMFNLVSSFFGDWETSENWLMAKFGRGESNADTYISKDVPDPDFFSARSLVLYGLPGLAGLQLSGRIGVGGLSLDPASAVDMLSGPTGGTLRDVYTLLKGTDTDAGFMEQNKRDTVLGLTAGVTAQMMGARYPLSLVFNSLAATALIGGVADAKNDTTDGLRNYLLNSVNGRKFAEAIIPNLFTGAVKTIDIFADQEAYDNNLIVRRYPSFQNRLFESITSMAGAQTVFTAEERAYHQYQYKAIQQYNRTRAANLERIAKVARDTSITSDEVMRLMKKSAEEDNIPISIADVQAAVDRLDMSVSERAADRVNRYLGTWGLDGPSGYPGTRR